MTDLVEHIRKIVDDHRINNPSKVNVDECCCEKKSLMDHSGHVAQQIIDSLGLRAEMVGGRIRYVSAWFDDELTKLEGAE